MTARNAQTQLEDRPQRDIAELFAARLEEELGQQLVSVVLYGSVARDAPRPDSDIDLLIVVDAPSAREKRKISERVLDLVMELERDGPLGALAAQGRLIDLEYRLYNKEEALQTHLFYLDLALDGVLLFDRERFFATKLDQVRRRMREYGTRRVYLEDGCWYWEFKPGMEPGEVVEF
jgi:predicted nucleotidyltransferase